MLIMAIVGGLDNGLNIENLVEKYLEEKSQTKEDFEDCWIDYNRILHIKSPDDQFDNYCSQILQIHENLLKKKLLWSINKVFYFIMIHRDSNEASE